MSATQRVPNTGSERAIDRLIVDGFKCFRDRLELELAPLTLLAGHNSSGKSSALQPLLLLKQTLEAAADPGALELDGPILGYTRSRELAWSGREPALFSVGVGSDRFSAESTFLASGDGISLQRCVVQAADGRYLQIPFAPAEAAFATIGSVLDEAPGEAMSRYWARLADRDPEGAVRWAFEPSRFSYRVEEIRGPLASPLSLTFDPWYRFYESIAGVLHLAGHRGHPQREYPLRSPQRFTGSFGPPYVASLLWTWQEAGAWPCHRVAEWLASMGLGPRLRIRRKGELAGEILVQRVPRAVREDQADYVNIADVGFGVSQVLPVLVALAAADEGQIVYIEQPELHLHPEAQLALARILVEAASRGVKVVAETHSPLLLLAIQTALVEGALTPDQTRLYWFSRDEEGAAVVTPGQLDEQGRYHAWPVDFWEVERQAQTDYVKKALGYGQ